MMGTDQTKTILGVDPGLRFTGFALIQEHRTGARVVDYGYLKLANILQLPKRIIRFHDFFTGKITAHSVTHIALETPFLGRNAQTFLKLGYLRGILYLLAEQHGCPLIEYAPRQVKQAVTGFGGATKEQVALMVQRMVPGLVDVSATMRDDVTDALAVAVCGLMQRG